MNKYKKKYWNIEQMKKFDKIYNNIILECKENKIISEGFFRKAAGLLKTKAGKNKMVKESIISWMNANKITQNGKDENKFIGTLKNGYTIKFTFRSSQWNDPKATAIDYAVYLKDTEGNDLTLDKKGSIDFGYSDNDIKKELTSKLKLALNKKEAKNMLTSRTDLDKAKAKEEKAAAKEQRKAEKAAEKEQKAADKKAAEEKAAEEKAAEEKAAAEKDSKELAE